ncbi:MAG: hypothetical protein J0H07_10495 [Sphingobacteriales bacterium]|nr:hypothetical protein [Sphingobacteriales bacterium]
MKFFKWLFKGTVSKVQCPRCIGKGHVDWNDIKRLNNELKWRPGRCAYCNGTGKVAPDMESKVAVDLAYLVNELPFAERKRLINNDPEAIKRAEVFGKTVDNFIEEIRDLFFIRNLEIDAIAEHFLQSAPDMLYDTYIKEKQALMDCIKNIIEFRKE